MKYNYFVTDVKVLDKTNCTSVYVLFNLVSIINIMGEK
jgi:hypothetical protein